MKKHHIHNKKHKLNRNSLLTRENISGSYTATTNNNNNNTNSSSTPSNCLYIVDPYTFKDLESARQLHATDAKVT